MNTKSDHVWKGEALAKTYLESVRGAIPLAAELRDAMLRVVAAVGEPIERFADLGCGNGFLAWAIFEHYPDAAGILLDFSPAMLQEAKTQLEPHGFDVRYTLSDFGSEDWLEAIADDAPFDLVVSGFAIHHQPDDRKRALYCEIFDHLKPGGLFLNMEHVSSPTRWVERIFDGLFMDSLYAFHVRRGAQKSREEIAEAYYHRPDKAANILAPVETQCDWLREIGFQDVDCYFKVFELALFGGRRPA